MRPAWAASVLATMINPDVSRSRRCTIPGRGTPAMPPYSVSRARSALTIVPLQCPGDGWTTSPAGLLTTSTSGSS